jgi:enoyl-CoA hydratase/carnithine racemase
MAELGNEELVLTMEGTVATIWLNRPAKRNAVTFTMWEMIPRLLEEVAANEEARVLVVRGAGDHFSGGADIAQLQTQLVDTTSSGGFREINGVAEDALARFALPTIAYITGFCVGSGCQIAVACDLRIADSSSRFGITPAKLGITYPSFAVERTVALMGASAAKHLLLSGELIDAQRALRVGLIDEVLEPELAVARLDELTATLASRSLMTQRAGKEMVADVVEFGAVREETAKRWEHEASTGPDVSEGVAAFLERRDPQFTWRKPAQS